MNELPPVNSPETTHVSIKIEPGGEDIPLPRYMSAAAAGMDIHALVDGELIIPPGERVLVSTGIAIALPEGFEAQIRPRSGLAIKHGVTILNAPGTIDSDYRGEIKIIMINHGREPFTIRRGDRIAQMVVHRVERVSWVLREGLDETARGEGGFGHTSL
ncbi:MAG: Deoxyuridine 5'-triphosphate nucleotidohydrolase [Syntrophus sp. SKADARSKE-3]|nr:Deoxyuridine 5'-triphosphate nucleotidohydrolase [Syntrophus sp. SKADARSKE-3]